MTNQPIGFWWFIRDDDDARDAVGLAGLPIFLIGLAYLLISAVFLLDTTGPIMVGGPIGLALMLMGLCLRAGKTKLTPYAFGLFALHILFALTLFGAATLDGGVSLEAIANLAVAAILPALLLVLMISGLRGWLWLRKARASHPQKPAETALLPGWIVKLAPKRGTGLSSAGHR
ncbi:hypothetical protein [Oryzifoliimicrobium ureilyticus]|uniref:hypothetical protein n=1 Tax=Oryzifoliimicrobium ureilyticus TaxID=3113724 RepID=UPI0030764EF2